MIKAFTDRGWTDYEYWHNQNDKVAIKRINKLINNIESTPFESLGKPEPLKYEFSGAWSRRITDEHRLIYKVENDVIYIISCRNHYE
ncbi:Txe/YoeB family addiction module toxin [Lapidilactobacillus bayanensis]|uniref:Txe/YoeB family addiction module toxin n=1 Tax=Lapidilactobacillus bayanensis TaxID=2485998 RepID=UPI000F78989E|nr:Txe/YoeB family addiction module toxin [Lapidilactobacillus bayanensis]